MLCKMIDNKLSLVKNLTSNLCFKKILVKASSTTLFTYSTSAEEPHRFIKDFALLQLALEQESISKDKMTIAQWRNSI
jgi:hypothetical protein